MHVPFTNGRSQLVFDVLVRITYNLTLGWWVQNALAGFRQSMAQLNACVPLSGLSSGAHVEESIVIIMLSMLPVPIPLGSEVAPLSNRQAADLITTLQCLQRCAASLAVAAAISHTQGGTQVSVGVMDVNDMTMQQSEVDCNLQEIGDGDQSRVADSSAFLDCFSCPNVCGISSLYQRASCEAAVPCHGKGDNNMDLNTLLLKCFLQFP